MPVYRFSAQDFGVYIDRQKLPSRAQWQAVANAKKLPLVFSEEFDPHKHSSREGEVVAKIGAATCRYRLDIHDKLDVDDTFRIESQRKAARGCNMALFFRWDSSTPDALAAYLSAATVAVETDGMIIWGRSLDDSRTGIEAFKVLTAKAWRQVKGPGYRFSKQDPFGPPLAMLPGSRPRLGGFRCPRCELNFDLDSRDVISGAKLYDGEKHTLCGQLLIAPDSSS